VTVRVYTPFTGAGTVAPGQYVGDGCVFHARAGGYSTTPHNHYSMLASIEDLFHIGYLGYAATPGLARFGLDIYR